MKGGDTECVEPAQREVIQNEANAHAAVADVVAVRNSVDFSLPRKRRNGWKAIASSSRKSWPGWKSALTKSKAPKSDTFFAPLGFLSRTQGVRIVSNALFGLLFFTPAFYISGLITKENME